MKEDYVSYITRIVTSDNLSRNEKLGYLYLAELASNGYLKDPKTKEDKSYRINGESLSDKDRIRYELYRLSTKSQEDTQREARKILYQVERKNGALDQAKKQITKLQIKNGLNPTFYTVFEDIIKDTLEEDKKSPFKK